MNPIRRIRPIGLVAAIVLAACAPAPPQPTPGPEIAQPAPEVSRADELERRAALAQGRAATLYRLEAAELRFAAGQFDTTGRLLDLLDEELLDTEQWLRATLLRTELALRQTRAQDAFVLLSQRRLMMALGDAELDTRRRARLLRAEALEGTGSYLAAAQERILLQPLLENDDAIRANSQAIWLALLQVPNPTLRQYQNAALSDTYRAWVELALIAKTAQLSLAAQNSALRQWLKDWPGHPAARFLPAEMASIDEMKLRSPESIALALPLSGALGGSGRAIRDGFLAAYYQSLEAGESVPSLHVVDSEDSATFLPLYHSLVEQGSLMVVGPLDKSALAELADLPSLPVPTLALNYLNGPGLDQQRLFQFGLSAQDEAAQLATRGRQEGLENALVIAPNSNWGRNVATTLVDSWRESGGTVVDVFLFSDPREYRKTLARSLAISASRQRARDLQSLLGQNLEFEPRRRQDIDVVLMVAAAEAARALKPMLSFHYAGDLPVYATSHVFVGSPDADRDDDLNGIQFIDMPWIADEPGPLKLQLSRLSEFADGRYQRLYALGVDAFRLVPRLQQWQETPGIRVFGETGSLRLNEYNQVLREGEWLQFQRGIPVPVPIDRAAGRGQGTAVDSERGFSSWRETESLTGGVSGN